MPKIHDRVLLVLGIAAALALGLSGFLDMAPNRLARGVDLPVWELSLAASAVIATPLMAMMILAFVAENPTHRLNDPSSFETPRSKSRLRDLEHE